MKLELIQLYKEYTNYVEKNFEYHEWQEVGDNLSCFIEFLETGKLSVIELKDITL